MDVTSISSINNIDSYSKSILGTSETTSTDNRNATFESLFQSAIAMVNETNDYTEQAKEAEMSYAMGTMTSTHDLQIAQQKANISLQYTVAVRNAVLDAYKEIMQIQF